jgi:hypothetical protein
MDKVRKPSNSVLHTIVKTIYNLREHFSYLVIVMRIILKLTLIKQDGKVWIKFISLNIETLHSTNFSTITITYHPGLVQ